MGHMTQEGNRLLFTLEPLWYGTNYAYYTISDGHGGRVYPTGYGFDAQGRTTRMTNWSTFPSTGERVTTWNYDTNRGWLTKKLYPDGLGPTYAYSAGARLTNRAWARGVQTGYTLNPAGEVATVDYPGAMPDVAFTMDRQGRQPQITQGSATTIRTFDTAGNLLSERYEGGPLAGLTVTNEYDHLLRRTNLAILNAQSAVLSSVAYTYDVASRLLTVRTGTNTATYSYLANSPLVSQIFFTNGSAWRMTTTKTYDHLDRLLGISSVSSASSVVSYGYSYNAANQRTSRLEADNSRWSFNYDALGQVVSGKRYWSDGVPTAGQQFEYGFDDIGNRTGTKAGGDENGANLRSASYYPNLLNQYWSNTVPGAVDVMGVTLATNTPFVNGSTPYRRGEYFRKELFVNNDSAPVWQEVTVAATNETSVTRHEYVPRALQAFVHDEDGNLTLDGRWQYTWDAENRLIAMTNIAIVPDAAKMALTFAYDWQGRRIEKVVYNWNPSTTNYQLSTRTKFLYDGWNLIARLDGAGNLLQTYAWGLDLSGTLQGAGGVGGLLFVSEISSSQISNSYAPAYDGNGNVMALVDCANGAVVSRYEYGPFGELLRATGPMATANPFRFSTKYQDDETDLLYYGYRYYSTSAGRWFTRDRIAEKGGLSLYCFVNNEPGRHWDVLGNFLEGGPESPPPNNIDPPPSGPFSRCAIALQCHMAHAGTCPVFKDHCGLVIDTGTAVYSLNGSGGSVNFRWLQPASTNDATGSFTDNPTGVCQCLLSNIQPWNQRNVPRRNQCENSNWNLKCMIRKCGVQLAWGKQAEPFGYRCMECIGTEIKLGAFACYGAACCGKYREEPCPDE